MEGRIKPGTRLQNAVVGHNLSNLGHNVGDLGSDRIPPGEWDSEPLTRE